MFNFWPVIVREVRSASRQPASYWIRLSAVALVLLIFFLIWFGASLPPQRLGRQLFNTMSVSMFCGIWIIAPLLSADCISREKRDGTLGLLFLTPLKAFDIVVAKVIAQALRTGTMLVAAVPALLLPVLIGGVSWMDGLRAVLLNLSALLIALAIGVAASTFCKRWMMAVITSLIISAGIACLFVWVYLLVRVYPNFQNGYDFWKYALSPEILYYQIYSRLDNLLAGLFQTSTSAISYSAYQGTFWMPRGTIGSSAADITSVIITGGMFILSFLGILLVLILAATRLNHFWKDHPTSKRQLWLLKVFCSPVILKDNFKRFLNRKLDSNPIVWLATYSWRDRLTKWGWFLGVMVYELMLLGGSMYSVRQGQTVLFYALAVGIAFTAVNSFRREKESHALELILVTPIREMQLIFGRWLAILQQFLPATLLFIMSGFYLEVELTSVFGGNAPFGLHLLKWLPGVMVIISLGVFLSLTRLNMLAAWGLSLLTSMAVPLLLGTVVSHLYRAIGNFYFSRLLDLWMIALTLFFQIALSVFFLILLKRKLTKRAFRFS